jgi:hypothetical protein
VLELVGLPTNKLDSNRRYAMSLLLESGTIPHGLSAKTYNDGLQVLLLGHYRISFDDFLATALYVLTNTNLEENDPRLKFIELVKKMKVVDGYLAATGGLRELPTKRLKVG